MRKRNKIIISSLIILVILFSAWYLYPLDKSRKWEDVKIDNGEDSIFTGFTTSEIAENLATAFDFGPLKLKELETHCGTSQYKYYYKNGVSISIFVDISSKSLWSHTSFNSPIIIHGGKNSCDEITNDPSKTTEFILSAWKQFLDGFNYQLNDEDYNITYKSWRESGLNVKIRQVCNNEIPLMNTGMDIHISQDDSQINTIKIDEWSRVKIERNISISLDDSKNIIENEIQETSINRSKLNFTGFIYFDENVYYYHNYEVPIEEVNNLSGFIQISSSNIINIKNGTIIEKVKYEEWVGYKFYVNVETNELTFSKYGISYLKK